MSTTALLTITAVNSANAVSNGDNQATQLWMGIMLILILPWLCYLNSRYCDPWKTDNWERNEKIANITIGIIAAILLPASLYIVDLLK